MCALLFTLVIPVPHELTPARAISSVLQLIYDVRQYWGLRKIVLGLVLFVSYFLSCTFAYAPLTGCVPTAWQSP